MHDALHGGMVLPSLHRRGKHGEVEPEVSIVRLSCGGGLVCFFFLREWTVFSLRDDVPERFDIFLFLIF